MQRFGEKCKLKEQVEQKGNFLKSVTRIKLPKIIHTTRNKCKSAARTIITRGMNSITGSNDVKIDRKSI
jgi:hypothetical protein